MVYLGVKGSAEALGFWEIYGACIFCWGGGGGSKPETLNPKP